MSDQERGLYRKYNVERLNDATGKHLDCEYFVLDLVHDKHATAALKAYADSCESEFPQLAIDLRTRYFKDYAQTTGRFWHGFLGGVGIGIVMGIWAYTFLQVVL